ncbi:hypothetical protein AB0M42_21835 [Streptomyces sp. NPDC051784]|uniref:hypothetical protein n=1 Tax=Streptomyces sp. NPDC051784 TaxID=3155805 RepID=UPI003435588D
MVAAIRGPDTGQLGLRCVGQLSLPVAPVRRSRGPVLADKVLAALSLRPLAEAIGTGPRVLLFLFESKDGLLRSWRAPGSTSWHSWTGPGNRTAPADSCLP